MILMQQQTKPYCKVLTYLLKFGWDQTVKKGRAWKAKESSAITIGGGRALVSSLLCFFAHALQHSWRQMIRGAIPQLTYVRTEGGREKEWQSANRNQAVQTQQNEDLQAVDYAATTGSASRKKGLNRAKRSGMF